MFLKHHSSTFGYITGNHTYDPYTCKKCGEPNFLSPHAFWNITDFGAKCEKCETINTITLENGELKKQVVLY
jgi:hypothetical protein